MKLPPTLEHNGQAVSSQRFYEIACDPARSVAVEACAGAGKTWMLVSRMLRALLDGASPQEILAITFTKKAAGEMRQRLQEWLRDFSHASDDSLREALLQRGLVQPATAAQLHSLRGLHTQLLQHGRPVQIRTFHSWFAALLGSAPLAVLHALELPTQYQLLENDAIAVAQVWRRFQSRVVQEPQAHADYLEAVATYGRFQAHKALASALAKRTEFALADRAGIVATSVAPFTQQFPQFSGLERPALRLATAPVQELLWECARTLGQCSGKLCQKAAAELERALTDDDASGVMAALLTQDGGARKLTDKAINLDVVLHAQALLLEIVEAEVQHQAWLHQQRMARLTRGLLQDYAALKRERGWIDMGDLELAALTLMSDPQLSGWVQERLDARVRHLLIDEFQDTNPLQWQALSSWLSSYAGAGSRPSVFIVGDPKQSIYRFRRAEPQVFRAARAFVRDGLEGDLLSCDHTRRNAPAIVDLVNQVMGQAQAAGEFDGFRPHTTASTAHGLVRKLPPIARAAKADADTGEAVWRDSLQTPRHTVEDTRKTLECRQAAQWLAQQLQGRGGNLEPRQVMVLARKRERLSLMAQELAALQVAALQPEKTELGECPEVQDLVALVDALVSPRHTLSLARALRSPVFGLGDADLVHLVQRQRSQQKEFAGPTPVTWLQVLQQAESLPAHLAGLGAQLTRWQQWLANLPPHDALSRIYDDGDVLARFAAACPVPMRSAVLANLRALLHAALQIDGGRYSTAYALVRALRAGGISAPVPEQAQAVRLLTVHGAKGLEASLVLVLDTDGLAPAAETMGVLVDWPGEAAHPRRFVFLASESRPPACVAQTLALEQQARQREELNTLYVALTRTQETLVLSSMEPAREPGASWWQRLQAEASATPVEAATAAPQPVAPDSFSLAGLPQRQALAVAPTAPPDSLESRMGQAMHRLLEWTPARPGGQRAMQWSPAQWARIAQGFALTPEQTQVVQSMACGILQGEGAWAWDSDLLAWHANEVPLTQAARQLYMDRLVQKRADGVWWVLDYKSSAAPQDDAELCGQLANYRAAVALAYPGQRVGAAFLTPQGRLIELCNP